MGRRFTPKNMGFRFGSGLKPKPRKNNPKLKKRHQTQTKFFKLYISKFEIDLKTRKTPNSVFFDRDVCLYPLYISFEKIENSNTPF